MTHRTTTMALRHLSTNWMLFNVKLGPEIKQKKKKYNTYYASQCVMNDRYTVTLDGKIASLTVNMNDSLLFKLKHLKRNVGKQTLQAIPKQRECHLNLLQKNKAQTERFWKTINISAVDRHYIMCRMLLCYTSMLRQSGFKKTELLHNTYTWVMT